MFRSATRGVQAGTGQVAALAWHSIEECTPLSLFSGRVSECNSAAELFEADAARLQQPVRLPQVSCSTGAWCEAPPSAAEQVYAEWSRQADNSTLALTHNQLPVFPLDLGLDYSQRAAVGSTLQGSLLEQHDLELLHSVLQGNLQDTEQVNTAPGAATPTPAPTPNGTSWYNGPAAGQGPQLLPTCEGMQAETAALSAAMVADALLFADKGNMGDPRVCCEVPQHASPCTLSAPAALPADPAQLPAAGPGTAAHFIGLFAGADAASRFQAGPAQEGQTARLHAPVLLPGYKLPTPRSSPRCSSDSHSTVSPSSSVECVTPPKGFVPCGTATPPTPPAHGLPSNCLAAGQHGGMSADGSFTAPPAAVPASQCWSTSVLPAALQEFATTGATSAVAPWHEAPSLSSSGALAAPAAAAASSGGAAAAGLLQGNCWSPDVWAGRSAAAVIAAATARCGSCSKHGGVRKPQGRVREHSSKKVKNTLQQLEAQHQWVVREYEGAVSLNEVLRQRYNEASAAFDAVLAADLELPLLLQQQQGQVFWSVIADQALHGPAAQAGVLPGHSLAAVMGPGPGNAFGTDLDDASLAAAINKDWLGPLQLLADLLPVLEGSSTFEPGRGDALRPAAHQQQQRQQVANSAAPEGEQWTPLEPLPSPFMAAAATATAAATDGADAAAAAGDGTFLLTSPLDALASGLQGVASGALQVNGKRARTSLGLEYLDTEQLGMLLSSCSLQAPSPKRRPSGGAFSLTESECQHLLALVSSLVPSQPLAAASDSTHQQQPQEASSGEPAAAGGGVDAMAVATQAAQALYDTLWRIFAQVVQRGPSLLYHCLGPKPAVCPCCSDPSQGLGTFLGPEQPAEPAGTAAPAAVAAGAAHAQAGSSAVAQGGRGDKGLMALLLDGDGAEAGAAETLAVGGFPQELGAVSGWDGAAAAAPASAAAAGPPAFVHATWAHWQRVREHLALTAEQQQALALLWSGVQQAHMTCVQKRAELLQALRQQELLLGGCLPIAAFRSCQGGSVAAGVTEQLLLDLDNSLAADFGVLLEASKRLWGDKSPLSLLQKVKCLIASYPFWPDYDLLACLAGAQAPA